MAKRERKGGGVGGEEIARMRVMRSITVIESLTKLVAVGIKAGAAVLIFTAMFRAVEAYAGKATKVDAVMSAVANLGMNQWFAYAIAGVFGFGYYHERKTRKKVISQHSDYIKQLETKVDPNRSSSGLTIAGEPTKEDLE